jgi:hypothetical protein
LRQQLDLHQTITVNDDTAPVITACAPDATVECAMQVPAPDDAAVHATDNCGGTVTVTHGADATTPGSCPGKYTVKRIYTASDACGNSSTCTQDHHGQRRHPAVITACAPDATVECASQIPAPDDSAVHATDNCGGTVTVTHSADATTPGSCPGKYNG